jgi:hypothetical protein
MKKGELIFLILAIIAILFPWVIIKPNPFLYMIIIFTLVIGFWIYKVKADG